MQYQVRYGGKRAKPFSLTESPNLIAVRAASGGTLTRAVQSADTHCLLRDCESILTFPHVGVHVLRVRSTGRGRALRDRARTALKKEPSIRFAGRVLSDRATGQPVVYTENFFVKFDDDLSERRCKQILKAHRLSIKRPLDYASNAFFVSAKEGTGTKIFDIAKKLLENEHVELCHPELVQEVRRRRASAQQWHLRETVIDGRVVKAHANVEVAWELTQGEGVTIAVIDDGVDIEHEEINGSTKIVAPRDVTRDTSNPRPFYSNDDHGTACAGVACANGNHGAAGVAPDAKLMPIRLASGLGSQDEADAFVWAADHGADVISCSWGPPDGRWWDDDDPLHDRVFHLPDSTRLAIDYAIDQGRGGKGCVITWAAGNGNESVDNDGYASYSKVIAVAACSDRSKRSVYSDFGDAIWCAFPSSNFDQPLTPGIWTTDRSGSLGYNSGGDGSADADGDYTDDFGGTSSACPGAAGVAALVIARNPGLRWDEVKEILKNCADKIGRTGGEYSSGHSPFYGYGRLNAHRALELAVPEEATYTALHTGVQTVPIRDRSTSKISVAVGDSETIKDVKIHVNIEHTYRGDLVLHLKPPSGAGASPILLQHEEGGSANNIKKTYDTLNTPDLLALIGNKPQGRWALEVTDNYPRDEGNILGFTVELGL